MSEPQKVNYYEFPNCMHVLNAALHMLQIDPGCVTIELPFDQWWKLSQILQSKFSGLMYFDGRQRELDSFKYMGFKFVCRKEKI